MSKPIIHRGKQPRSRRASVSPLSVKCPDCFCDCVCDGNKITDEGVISTDWYGVLHYYKCRCCGTKFVSQDGKKLETAAMQ